MVKVQARIIQRVMYKLQHVTYRMSSIDAIVDDVSKGARPRGLVIAVAWQVFQSHWGLSGWPGYDFQVIICVILESPLENKGASKVVHDDTCAVHRNMGRLGFAIFHWVIWIYVCYLGGKVGSVRSDATW